MAVSNRLRQYLMAKNINNRMADDMFGYSNGLTGRFLAGKGQLGVDKIERILSACPDLNGDWLLTGRGSMLLEFPIYSNKVEEIEPRYQASRTKRRTQDECEQLIQAKDDVIASQRETINALKSMLQSRTFST